MVQHEMAALANLHAKYDLQQSMVDEAQAKLAADEAEPAMRVLMPRATTRWP